MPNPVEQVIDRRHVLLSMAGLGLSALTVSGCGPTIAEVQTGIAQDFLPEIQATIKSKLPDVNDEAMKRMAPGEEWLPPLPSRHAALVRLNDTLELLEILAARSYTLNGHNEGSGASDFHVKRCLYPENVSRWGESFSSGVNREGVQWSKAYFQDLAKFGEAMRACIAKSLTDCGERLMREVVADGAHTGQAEIETTRSLNIRLSVIAERIVDRSFLISDNILNYSHKTGSTSNLIGRTEHYAEACAEVKQLQLFEKLRSTHK